LLPVRKEVEKHLEDQKLEKTKVKLSKAQEKIKQMRKDLDEQQVLNFLYEQAMCIYDEEFNKYDDKEESEIESDYISDKSKE